MIAKTTLAVANGTSEQGITPSGNPILELAQQFHVDTPFLIAQIINFCIVAFILYKFAFKPVVATIEERQKKIADGLQYAEEMKSKLAEVKKKEAQTLEKAQQQAQKIIDETRQSAKALLEKQSQEAAAKAETILQKAEQAIAQERKRMLSEVHKEIAGLVVQTAGKVLRKELSEQEKAGYSQAAAQELYTIH